MTDLLERLRAANPVRECGLPEAARLWLLVDADDADCGAPIEPVSTGEPGLAGGRRRPRIARRLAVGASLLGIVALVVGLGGRTGASVAARAYAATASTGVIDHYVEVSRVQPAPGGPAFGYADSRAEVWFSGSRSHILATYHTVSAAGHRSVSRGEQAVADGRAVNYDAGSNAIYSSVLPPPGDTPARSCETLLVCGMVPADAITTLRELYEAGRLHDAGETVEDGRRLDVLVAGETAGRGRPPAAGTAVRILVDPSTFIPVEVVQTSYGALGRSPVVRRLLTQTTTIDAYQRIPLTPKSSQLLVMRPHPGAHVICAIGRRAPARGAVVLAPC